MKLLFKNMFKKQEEEKQEFQMENGKIVGYDYGGENRSQEGENGGKNSPLNSQKVEEYVVKNEEEKKVLEVVQEEKEEVVIEKKEEVIEKVQGRTRNLEGFFMTLKSAGKSKNTVRSYRYDIEYWKKVASRKRKTIYALKMRDIEEAIVGSDINTVKRKISALKQLSKWYLRDGFAQLHIELEKVMLGKGKARIPKAKSKEDFVVIRDHAKQLVEEGKREGIWLGLMTMCGLRISEIQTVVVAGDHITVIGKGDKERKVPCQKWLIKALKTFKDGGYGGYRKNRKIIDRALRKLGYTNCHSLRHTFATMLLHQEVELEKIQLLLGHSSVATTQIYAKTKIERGITDVLEQI